MIHIYPSSAPISSVFSFCGRHMQIIGNSRSLFASATDDAARPTASASEPAPAVLQDRSSLQPPASGKASAGKASPQPDGQQGSKPDRRKALRFASLDLPPMDALSGCDETGGVRSYEDAVKQFNKALAAFKGALEVRGLPRLLSVFVLRFTSTSAS